MQGSKKAGRQLKYDEDIEDARYEDFYDDDYNDDDFPAIKPQPRRSVTLSDFFAPGLLSKEDKDSSDIVEDKSKNLVQPPSQDDIVDDYDEEEYDEYDDSKKIDRCFDEIEKRYDISNCDEEEIIIFLRDCNYRLSDLWPCLKDGEFGIAKPISKSKAKAKAKNSNAKSNQVPLSNSSSLRTATPPMNSPNKSVNISFQPTIPKASSSQVKVNFPVRSLSLNTLSKITEQHQCSSIDLGTIKKRLSTSKHQLNLVIIGHVDAGKSTLMGHLLLLQGKVDHSKMSQIERESKRQGKEEDKYAWIMAEDTVERERGITIDVAMTDFETEHFNITILDAPGHRDYVPNMIAGASQADAALLVIDAANTNFDRGQAKEHLFLCRALGVQNIIVAINKMDTVSYDEGVYQDVKKQINAYLRTRLGIQALFAIPTAATLGLNLNKESSEMSWYKGPTILTAIDSIPPPQISTLLENPFLLCVSQSVETGNRSLVISGRVESGFVCKDDVVKISPGDVTCKVNEVRSGSGNTIDFAIAGQIAEIQLHTQISSDNVPPGSALSDLGRSIPYSNSFIAKVVTYAMNVPLLKGSELVFYRHAVDMPLHIVQIICLYNKKKEKKMNPGFVPSNSTSEIQFRLDSSIALEKFTDSKSFGRFIIRARGETLGFGSILEVLPNFVPVTRKQTYSDE